MNLANDKWQCFLCFVEKWIFLFPEHTHFFYFKYESCRNCPLLAFGTLMEIKQIKTIICHYQFTFAAYAQETGLLSFVLPFNFN